MSEPTDPTPHRPDIVRSGHDDAAGDDERAAADPGLPGDTDLGGLLGGIDLGGLLGMAGDLQRQLADAQSEAAATLLEGAAGGGKVTVTVTGAGEFRSVVIDPEVVDPDDIEMLQDLVLAALHDATAQVEALQQRSGGVTGLVGGLPGLGNLGDLFGGTG